MKKNFVLFSLLLLGFFLIGCEKIGQQAEQPHPSLVDSNQSKQKISVLENILQDGKTGVFVELKKALGEAVSDMDKDFTYSVQKQGAYFFITITSDGGEGWVRVVAKIADKYEVIWDGDGLMYTDCERLMKKYPGLFQQENGFLSYCSNVVIDTKTDNLSDKEMCEYGYLQKLIFTSSATKEYIKALNLALEESKKTGEGLIDYRLKSIDGEKSDAWYFGIEEVHKDGKDTPARSIIIRRYKIEPSSAFYENGTVNDNYSPLDLYEYDVANDAYIRIYEESDIMREYINNCPVQKKLEFFK